jgi:hypothetical protein
MTAMAPLNLRVAPSAGYRSQCQFISGAELLGFFQKDSYWAF